MPVRSTIHWSEVSRVFSNSAFVTTRSGTADPEPGEFDEGARYHATGAAPSANSAAMC